MVAIRSAAGCAIAAEETPVIDKVEDDQVSCPITSRIEPSLNIAKTLQGVINLAALRNSLLI